MNCTTKQPNDYILGSEEQRKKGKRKETKEAHCYLHVLCCIFYKDFSTGYAATTILIFKNSTLNSHFRIFLGTWLVDCAVACTHYNNKIRIVTSTIPSSKIENGVPDHHGVHGRHVERWGLGDR